MIINAMLEQCDSSGAPVHNIEEVTNPPASVQLLVPPPQWKMP
jgi:hypothetical protein